MPTTKMMVGSTTVMMSMPLPVTSMKASVPSPLSRMTVKGITMPHQVRKAKCRKVMSRMSPSPTNKATSRSMTLT